MKKLLQIQERPHKQRWKSFFSALLLISMLCTLICGISVPISAAQSFNPVWPCDAYYVTCLYYYSSGSKHSATYWDKSIDIAKNGDVNVYAIEAGTVTYSGWSTGGLGYKVMIEHANGHTSIYGHLKTTPLVSKGTKVTRGQVIGKMGGTGGYGASAGTISFGQHLHFEYSGADLWDTVWKDSLKSSLTYEANCYNNNYRGGTYNGNDSKSKNIVSWLSANYTKNSSGIYTYNGSHSHSYSIIEYEAAHPHKAYTKCLCGKTGDYTGATMSLSSCSSCVGTCSCSTSRAGTYTCVTSNYPLTIRSGHSTNSDAIGSIPSGASVTVTKASGTGKGHWGHVTYNGVSGYASMEYLAKPYSTSSAYPVPFKGYTLSDANHAADAYDAPNGNHIGYIYGGDYCTVKEVYSNGWCLVNCPWGSSTKDVYTWTGNFLNTAYSTKTRVVEESATTYIRYNSTAQLGWVDVGDKIVVVDAYGSQLQIIYPHTDGTYRCAWIDATSIVHNHTPGPAATCTSPQVCTSCDTIIVGKKSHTPGPAATCTSNQTCAVCGVVLNTKIAHTPGTAATCITPQMCTVCNTVLASTIDHRYTAGNYTDPAHPHKIYNTCSCGAQKDSGSTTKVSGCIECYPAPTVSGITYSPSTIKAGDTVTFTLNATGATAYQLVIGDGTNVLKRTEKTANNTTTYTFTSEGSYSVWGYAYNGETSATVPTISVTVSAATVSVNSVSLNKTSATIDVGETLVLVKATILPADATNKSIIWTSSDPSVATVENSALVDGGALITGLTAGTTTITATTVDGSKTATCVVTVNEATIVDADVIYTIGSASGKPGSTVEIALSVAADVAVNGLLLDNLSYDENALEFVEFAEYGDLITTSALGANGVDSAKGEIALGYTDAVIPNGQICIIKLRVKDTAEDGEYTISIDGAASANGQKLSSEVNSGKITISKWVSGDFDSNEKLDMKDVVYFMNWINFSWTGKYPMVYDGDKDFNKDGNVDMKDVVYFMNWVNFSWTGNYDINW